MTPKQSSLQRNTDQFKSRHCWYLTIYHLKGPRWSTELFPDFFFDYFFNSKNNWIGMCVLRAIQKIRPYIQLRNPIQSEVTKLDVAAAELLQQAVSIRVLGPNRSDPPQHTVSSLCCRCWWEAQVHFLQLLAGCGLEPLKLLVTAATYCSDQMRLRQPYAPPVSLRSSRSSLARFSFKSLEPGLSSRALS